jgi:hypothetical protein
MVPRGDKYPLFVVNRPRCSLWPSDDLPTPLRPPVDTGAWDRGGASAKFAVAAETVGCREGVDSVVLR